MKKYKLIALVCCMSLIISMFCGCSKDTATASQQATFDEATTAYSSENIDIDIDDIEGSIDIENAPVITLNDTTATAENDCAEIDDSTVKITKQGVYVLTGKLSNGKIKVEADENSIVVLVLKNADITNKSGAAIHIKKALSTFVVALSDTENSIADTENYEFAADDTDGEPDATLFSKSDLVVGGGGTLDIDANYSSGIKCKDNLTIAGSTLDINSVDVGIKARDSLQIRKGDIKVTSTNDGIKTTNDTDNTLANISISGGTLDISAGTDGIQSENSLSISGGDITIKTASGSSSVTKSSFGNFGQQDTADETDSAKGIKAQNDIIISTGKLSVDSSDDSIHSNDSITISGGTISLASGDDGIHADNKLEISGATIDITNSYEGIEALIINISGGDIHMVSSDDGINCAGGNDSSNLGGMGGGDRFAADSGAMITVSGGYIYIDASGDGFDSNGSAKMSGGTLIVDGPTNSGNGAIDYNGTFELTGGLLIAAGASGMAQAVSDTSTQYCIMATISNQSAGTLYNISDSSGNSIVTYAPSKQYSNVVVCSKDIKSGENYTISTGGSSTGKSTDGLYTGGSYSGGSTVTTITTSSVVSSYGSGGMNGGMGGMGGMGDMGGGKMDGGKMGGGMGGF